MKKARLNRFFDHPVKERTRAFVNGLKVLHIHVNSESFDFIGTQSQIEEYCYKNQVSVKTAYRISSVFEELCVQILMPTLSECDISMTVEYSEKSPQTRMVLRYGVFLSTQRTQKTNWPTRFLLAYAKKSAGSLK